MNSYDSIETDLSNQLRRDKNCTGVSMIVDCQEIFPRGMALKFNIKTPLYIEFSDFPKSCNLKCAIIKCFHLNIQNPAIENIKKEVKDTE